MSFRILQFLSLILLISACQPTDKNSSTDNQTKKKTTIPPKPEINAFKLEWASEPVFSVPESAVYDEKTNKIYVSNIAGDPMQMDNKGFISTMTLDGKVEKIMWVSEGLSAPKGMLILDDKLYVTDINAIVKIDIPSAKVEERYLCKDAFFMNDICEGPDGNILAGCTARDVIYSLKDDKVSVWMVDNPKLDGPNGLKYKDGKLYVATMKGQSIQTWDYATQTLEKEILGSAASDGIDFDSENFMYASDWNGRIFKVEDDSLTTLLDTKGKHQTADVSVIKGDKLLVPTFFDNRVLLYQLRK